MNVRILLTGLFLYGSPLAPAQNTFIVHLDSVQFGQRGNAHSVKEVSDGYLVFGLQRWNSSFPAHLFIHKLDLSGSPEFQKEFLIGDLRDHVFGPIDPVGQVGSDGFAGVVLLAGPGIEFTNIFMRFNTAGDSLFTTHLLTMNPDTTGGDLRWLKSVSTGGYVACGAFDDGTTARGLLARIDSAGSLSWIRLYGADLELNSVSGVAEYFDSGFLLTGTRAQVGMNDNTFLIRTDSLGNQIWRRQFGDDGYPGSVRMSLDSTIVTWSTYQHPTWLFTWFDMQLIKWDSAGNVIWEKHVHYGPESRATDIEVLSDGGYITVGNAWGAMLTRFNSAGDSLWSRMYEVFDRQHETYDVEPTSDGGFILSGSVQQDTTGPTPGLQTMFIVKIDSFGCVVPGCQNVGVQEYELGLQEHLVVSPNPAHERVSFTLEIPPGYAPQGSARAVLLDATGRQVMEEVVPRIGNFLSHTLTLQPSTPSGLYYLHLRDGRRWLAGSKVVVE